MSGAVVGKRLVLSSHGDRLGVDGELTVDPLHVGEVGGLVVAVLVEELVAVVDDVGRVASISPRARSRGLVGEALGQARGGDAGVGERGAVVGLRIAGCSQDDLSRAGRYGESAEVLGNGVVVSLGVVPRDGVDVIRRADLSNRTSCLERHGLACNQAADVGFVLGERGAIVGLGGSTSGDRNSLWVDGQLAVDLLHVGEVGGLVVAVLVEELVAVVHDVGALAGVGLGAAGCGLVGEALGQAGGGDAGVGERGAVVGLGVAGCGQNDISITCRNRQRAEVRSDGVVVLLSSTPSDGIRVAARSDLSLGTGSRDGRGLTVHKAGDGRLRLGKRGTVVGLGGGTGVNREGGRVDRQGAVDLLHVGEKIGHVFAVGVLDDVAVVDDVVTRADVGLGAAGRRLDREALGQAGGGDGGVSQSLAVVGLGAAGCGQSYLGVILGDLERAQLVLDGVVIRLNATPVDGVGVVRTTDLSL